MAVDRDGEFYRSVNVGDIIHVDWNFRSFVRCEVINVGNFKRLKPLSLRGRWHPHELPHRTKTGEPYLGTAALIVNNEDLVFPYSSVVFESPWYAYKDNDEVNPNDLPDLDLTVPAITQAQARDAVFYRAIENIRGILHVDPFALHTPTPREQLENVQALVVQVLSSNT